MKIYRINIFSIVLILLTAVSTSIAQMFPLDYKYNQTGNRILSNVIVDIVENGSQIWFGTTKGVMMTSDDGESFQYFDRNDGIGKGSVSALTVKNGVVWIATAFDTVTSEGELSAGGGLAYSENNGETWHYINQPIDSRDETNYKPTTTNVQNVTYDIAIRGDTVWIASWGGGIRRSVDKGATWTVHPPDDLPFDALQYLNHRGFSVISARNGLWIGTASGINKSTDGGKTWTHYTSQNSNISGDFVTALAEQRIGDRSIIWAATWKAEGEDEEYGVSKTENNGLTWEVALSGLKIHNFGFHDNEVYAAGNPGLWKSDDLGKTWAMFPPIADNEGRQLLSMVFNGVNFIHGALWAASNDGLVRTGDNGNNWEIFRAFQLTSEANEMKTYAYPNPFSPSRHGVLGMDGHVRIQYNTLSDTKVSLAIYDFAMKKVADVVKNEMRFGGQELSEKWNGKNDRGDQVANGVYFYKIEIENQGTHWGKIVVID